MKLGSLVKIKPNNACLGLRMDEKLPYLLKQESLMILLSVGHIEGFCKVLLLEQKKTRCLDCKRISARINGRERESE